MLEKIRFEHLDHTDLNMYQCGIEDCSPGHYWGPAVRDHFLIHYILKGKGIFQVGNNTFHLQKGNGFLICPGVVAQYKADMSDPWSYSWVGFHGLKAEMYLKQAGISLENPVFKYEYDNYLENCIKEMIASKEPSRGREIHLLGLLYLFLYRLVSLSNNDNYTEDGKDRKELYVKKAVEYIEMNYANKISISDIAAYIGLDRSYFYSIFKHYLNMSPQEFLIKCRIDKACYLMNGKNLSIGDISRSVGYNDPLLFSKIFKKVKNISPREYRKKLFE